MKFYYHPVSVNARRALAPALHMGLRDKLELITVDLTKGEHMTPAFLQLNPNHKIPVLVDGDFHLWESFAIATYLADQAKGQTLWPEAPRQRADVLRWVMWHTAHFGQAVGTLNFENLIKPMFFKQATDAAAVAKAEKDLQAFAPVLDKQLEGRKWLLGDPLTLADFYIAAAFGFEPMSKLPIASYKNILAWNQRLLEVPAWKETAPKLG